MSDKKSNYVGNHGGTYTDIDGMSRQFTYIDHDRKLPSRTKTGRESKEVKAQRAKESEERKAYLKKMNDDRISAILSMPPYDISMGEVDPFKKVLYYGFIVREVPAWDEPMVRATLEIDKDLCQRLFFETWCNTVKEEHWKDDVSFEDIIAGKWKELM